MAMTPTTAYRAALQAQHPERHAPELCVTPHGFNETNCICGTTVGGPPVLPGERKVGCPTWCRDCDVRLAPDAPLLAEVQAAVDAAVRACVAAARDFVRLYTDAMGRCDASWAADRVAVAVERAARECGTVIP